MILVYVCQRRIALNRSSKVLRVKYATESLQIVMHAKESAALVCNTNRHAEVVCNLNNKIEYDNFVQHIMIRSHGWRQQKPQDKSRGTRVKNHAMK